MPNGGVTLNAAYMRPASRGTVKLKSADPMEAPLIDPNYMAEPEDARRGLAGLKIAREIMRQPALQPFLKAERLPGPGVGTDDELFDYVCRNAKTQHHPCGRLQDGHRRHVSGFAGAPRSRSRWSPGVRQFHHAADLQFQH